jgi:hypothetical protein
MLLRLPVEADDARLPYSYIYRIQKLRADLCQAHPSLQITLQLQSSLPNVKYSELRAYLDSKSGQIPVKIGPDGEFSLPAGENLLQDDPWLVTNQPKGTMQLNWQAGLSQSFVRQMTNTLHYAPLLRAMHDCADAQAKMREFFPDSPKLTVAGLKLIFPAAAKSPVVIIHARNGEQKLEADASGELILPLDDTYLRDDPLVTFSAVPAKVQLVSRQGE